MDQAVTVRLVAGLMRDLSEKGVFRVPEAPQWHKRELFECGFATDEGGQKHI